MGGGPNLGSIAAELSSQSYNRYYSQTSQKTLSFRGKAAELAASQWYLVASKVVDGSGSQTLVSQLVLITVVEGLSMSHL